MSCNCFRLTVLRDLEGSAHFIPNGQIRQVTNLTHTWSRALFDIAVPNSENADHVIEVLTKVAKEFCDDPEFGPFTVGEPEMLGVDDYIRKPFAMDRLVESVERLLA